MYRPETSLIHAPLGAVLRSLPELLIRRAAAQQLLVGAHIGHSALLQHADLIRIHDGVEPVGDDEDCLTPDHFGNGLVHLLLILRIHEGGGLVQHHDRGVFQDRPGQRDALPLPAGKHFAPVPGHGVDAILQPGEELPALGLLRRGQHFLVRGLRAA